MKVKIPMVFIISLILLTGCWDKVEIDRRLFVSSIGVDLNGEDEMNRFIVTYEYPNINAIGKEATEEQKAFVVSTPSSSIFQAGKEFTTRVAFPFYYKHVKVLILGEDLVNQGKLVREVLDELNRDTKVNKKVQILAAKGRAKSILETEMKRNQTTDEAIYTMLREGERNSNRFTPQTLTKFIRDADYCGATLIPKIFLKGDEILVSGGCIMKNYKHIAWIGERENRALSMINGRTKRDTIDIPYRDSIVSFTITRAKSVKSIRIEKDINMDISILLEGYLQGYIAGDHKRAYDDRSLKDMERSIESFIKREAQRALKLIQEEYNADLIGVGEHLSKFHPRKWKKIEDSWDEMFPRVKFNLSIDANIRRTGLIK